MSYKVILIPLVAGVFTQVVKFVLQAATGHLRWSTLREYGGMPSAHTAFVVSLATAVAMHDGWRSTTFAISVIFALLIIRDAIGLRQFLSQHARVLNMLVKELPDAEEKKFPSNIIERLGHTPMQAFVGGLIGLLVALSLYTWI